jgi:hypothetical protein
MSTIEKSELKEMLTATVQPYFNTIESGLDAIIIKSEAVLTTVTNAKL